MKLRPGWVAPLGLLIALLAFLPSTAGHAQEDDAQLSVEVASFAAGEGSSGQAVVTVLGLDGRPVPGLTPEHFHLRLGEADAPVASLSQGVDSELGIAVVLALDTSLTMQGAPIEQAKLASLQFLDGLGPQDSIAVLSFADTVTLTRPFTQDRQAARAAVEALNVGFLGGTALYDATAESLRLAASAESSRRAVVLLSDGEDNVSRLSQSEALSAGQTQGVPVFVIALGEEIDWEYLRNLAEASSGLYAETPSPEGLAELFQDVGELLRGQYILDLDLSGLDLDAVEAAMLRVEVTDGERAGSDEYAVCIRAATCVVLTDVTDGETLSAERTIGAQVVAASPVESVSFLMNGQTVAVVNEPPYQFTFDPAAFEGGAYTLEARAYTAAGETATTSIAVRTSPPSTAGDILIPIVAVGLIVVVVLLGGFWFLRLRRRGGGEEDRPAPVLPPEPDGDAAPVAPEPSPGQLRRLWEDEPQPSPQQPEVALGSLYVVSGPHAGQSFPVGAGAISIGSGHRCLIRAPEEEGDETIAPEHARVWVRDNQLMVHEVKRLTVTGSVGGNWSILDAGEVFKIGPWTFRFDLDGHEPPGEVSADALQEEAQQQTGGDVPNILRDVPKWSARPLREGASETAQEPVAAPEHNGSPAEEEASSEARPNGPEEPSNAPQPNGAPSAEEQGGPPRDAGAPRTGRIWPPD